MKYDRRDVSYPVGRLLGGIVLACGFALSASAIERPSSLDGAKIAKADAGKRSADKIVPVDKEKNAKDANSDQSKVQAEKNPPMLFYCYGSSCDQLFRQFFGDGK